MLIGLTEQKLNEFCKEATEEFQTLTTEEYEKLIDTLTRSKILADTFVKLIIGANPIAARFLDPIAVRAIQTCMALTFRMGELSARGELMEELYGKKDKESC